jgi:hypothetical protein
VFVVKWKDFAQEESMWETYEDIAVHDIGLLEEYDKKNPAMEREGRFRKTIKDVRKRRRKT